MKAFTGRFHIQYSFNYDTISLTGRLHIQLRIEFNYIYDHSTVLYFLHELNTIIAYIQFYIILYPIYRKVLIDQEEGNREETRKNRGCELERKKETGRKKRPQDL